MGCLSLKHITASAPSASLGWVHRLREKGFSTLKAFSLLTVINKGREEPILFLRARLLTFCNAWGICMEEKKIQHTNRGKSFWARIFSHLSCHQGWPRADARAEHRAWGRQAAIPLRAPLRTCQYAVWDLCLDFPTMGLKSTAESCCRGLLQPP